jgi:hypothetical protein
MIEHLARDAETAKARQAASIAAEMEREKARLQDELRAAGKIL